MVPIALAEIQRLFNRLTARPAASPAGPLTQALA
jgi:hypothetical protein